MGILSTVGLLLVIVVDGFSKAQSPGSLLDPSETNFLFGNWKSLGFAFGLFMAGVSTIDRVTLDRGLTLLTVRRTRSDALVSR